MCADRTIGIPDRDRTLQDGLEGLPDIKTLGLAANKDRYRLEVERRPARRLGCRNARVLRHDGSFARRRRGVELRLQFGFGGCPLRLELGGPRDCPGFGILRLLLCLGRPCGGDRTIGGGQLLIGSELQVFGHAHRCSRGFSGRRHGSESRLIGLAGRLVRVRGPGGGDSAGARLRGEQSRMDDLDGRYVAWRHDYPHAQLGQTEQAFGEVVGHPDTAV